MNRLSKITLATLLGASIMTGCGEPKRAAEGTPNDLINVRGAMTGVPMDVAQYTPESHYVTDSYTFPIMSDGVRKCVYRRMGNVRDNQHDRMIISLAYKEQAPITFSIAGRTDDGCYVMTSRPSFFKEPVSFR